MNHKRLTLPLMVLLGNTIYALAVKCFLLPANLISTGTTGLALVMEHLFHIPLSGFIFVFNVAMLLVGWKFLGRQFAMSTIFSSLYYPAALEALNRILGDFTLTQDILLNTLFAGLGIGLGLGIVLRAGASTGGMDIPPLVLKKFFRVPVSASLWGFDLAILLSQMGFHPLEDLLYGIILLIAITTTLNKVMLMGTSRTEVKIVSPRAEEIREGILSQVDRGVTMLHGEGGYLRQNTEVILSIVSNHELPKIERLARAIDPECFMIVSQVTEVWGGGFSFSKRHLTRQHPAQDL